MYFPVADIDLNPLIPVAMGLAVSLLGSPAGISGGFLILPLSINFLGFTSPAASPTNYIFNVISMPPGLWRLHREGRLMPAFGLLLMAGSLPGIFAGTVLRATWLKEAAHFRLFVALVLTALAVGLLVSFKGGGAARRAEGKFRQNPAGPKNLACAVGRKTICYEFGGEKFTVSTPAVTVVSLAVGLVGGIYGIGGAAIIAPVLVGLFRMPVYAAAGCSMLAGWAGGVFGLFSYAVFWPLVSGQPPILPDFKLGLMFGLGGMMGVYAGAAAQRHLPPKPIKLLMLALILVMAAQNYGLF